MTRAGRDRAQTKRHDWRWFVGGFGKVLISVGLLLFGFVAYQLWGTGLRTAQAQSRLSDEFTELLSNSIETGTTTPPDTSAVTTNVPTTDPTASDPVTSDSVPATATTTPPTTTVPAPIITAPPRGEPLARLDIPRIGMEGTIIIEGVSPADLRDGPGHFPETPLPGQFGNSALAGHRTTHGQPFFRIDELQPGDDIVVTTLAGRYVYVVTGTVIVGPNDYQQVIPTVDPTRATLALTSCHPRWSTRQRIVVNAEIDLTRSDLVTAPGPLPPPDAIDSLPSDPSTSDPVTSDPGTSDPGTTGETVPSATAASTPATDPTATTDPDVTAPAGTNTGTGSGSDDGDDGPSGADVFGGGWFSDEDAFLPVAMWGMVLALIALVSWRISCRVRRNWVGGLLGVVPFLLVLYLFFENVNRLLPANL